MPRRAAARGLRGHHRRRRRRRAPARHARRQDHRAGARRAGGEPRRCKGSTRCYSIVQMPRGHSGRHLRHRQRRRRQRGAVRGGDAGPRRRRAAHEARRLPRPPERRRAGDVGRAEVSPRRPSRSARCPRRRRRAPSASAFIAPGATLGVLGGGQLGRMFVARRAASRAIAPPCSIPIATSPAGLVAHEHVRAGYLDAAGLARLAEISRRDHHRVRERPGRGARRPLARSRPVAPGADAVAVCQDRAAEKAAFAPRRRRLRAARGDRAAADLDRVADALLPGILKTRAPRLRRQGPARGRRPRRAGRGLRRARRRAPACSSSASPLARRDQRHRRPQRRGRRRPPAGAGERAPRRHPRA